MCFVSQALSRRKSENLTFKTKDGGTISGKEIVDPFWAEITKWATEEQPKLAAEQQRNLLESRILAHPGGRADPRGVRGARGMKTTTDVRRSLIHAWRF